MLALLTLGLGAPAAQSAVGAPFATADFAEAPAAEFVVLGPVQAAAHNDVIVKVTVSDGRLEHGEGDAGAVWWLPVDAIAAGAAPMFATGCDSAVNVPCGGRVEWYDVADLPSTLSGMITSGIEGESTLVFPTPIGGPYSMDVGGPTTGDLIIEHNACHGSTFGPIAVSPPGGAFSLGSYPAGQQAICVHAPDGGSARWSISFGKDQAIVDSLTLSKTLIRPDDSASFSYVVDNPTYVTSWISDSINRTVRTLSTNFPVAAAGLVTQAFDGLDDAGHSLPDGRYTLNVTVVGEAGSSSDSTPLTIDGTSPTIDVPTRSVSSARGAITVHISDNVGVSSATITARGVPTLYSSIGNGTITFTPSRDWISGVGKNTISITAQDLAGNTSQLSQSLTYAPPKPKAPASSRGHVDKAWISRLAAGRAAHAFPQGTRALYASFHFSRLPARGSVTTIWYEPDGTATRAISKHRAALVRAFVKSSAALPRGLWRCVLRVNGVATRDVSVRVG